MNRDKTSALIMRPKGPIQRPSDSPWPIQGIVEDAYDDAAGEEADHAHRLLADIANVVRDKRWDQSEPARGELASLVADGRLRLSREDEDDLLGAVGVHPGVLAGLELEVPGSRSSAVKGAGPTRRFS